MVFILEVLAVMILAPIAFELLIALAHAIVD